MIQDQEIQYGGLIMEVSENDFILGSDNIAVQLANRENPDDIIYQYNQAAENVTRNACSVFASSAAVNDLANRPESNEILKDRWLRAIELGAEEARGWFFYKAVDLVRKEFNLENSNNKIVSFRLQNGETLKAALKAGYSIVAGFKGNSAYNIDKLDGRIDGTEFPNWTYGHCVRIREQLGKIVVVDNMYGAANHNIYELADFDKLVENDVYFNEFYLFIREKSLTRSQLKRLWAKGKGIWNGQYENSFSTRGEIAEMSINTAIKFIEGYPFNNGTMTKRQSAQSNGIWNGENENGNCTRYEASLMIERATGNKVVWSEENPNQFITRGEVAEMIANTFA